MMEWISHWLQNIILVVLLATFVDLLLPTANMQKYAKMVLGLIVILSMITPILSLISKEFSLQTMIQKINEKALSDANINIPVMEEMAKNENKLNQQFKQSLIQQVEKSMKQHLTSLLENRFNVTVRNVALKAKVNENLSWQIENVQIDLLKGKRDEMNQQKKEIKEIENVEIVSVNTDKPLNQIYSNDNKEIKNTKDDSHLREQIVQVIKEQWGLKEEQIMLRIGHDLG
ncbi:stage III sporulation protein AF [Tepidibacillus sp. LV47]|uniref:stage III sporulation protein AF n=1 Tax=Tepidibacillus sp. LV47 TaxID=3398228 RepID=UPI003AAEC13E